MGKNVGEDRHIPDPGDLAACPDGDGWIVGVCNGLGRIVFGDVERVYERAGDMYSGNKERFRPEAGRLIGRRFASLDELRAALVPVMQEVS